MTCNLSRTFRSPWVVLTAIMALAALLTVVGARPAEANHPDNPGAIAPHGKPYGKSYGDWAAEWWKWAGAFQVTAFGQDPITEGDGPVVYGDDNQSGPVWFLSGNFGGPVSREITVPAGKALFMPLVNFVFWNPEDCEYLGLDPDCSASDLKHKMREVQAMTINLEMTVDDVDFVGLDGYSDISKAFPLTISLGDLFNFLAGYDPGVRDPSVAGGHWMMLEPLAPGEHTIHWGGKSDHPLFSAGDPQDVTYTVTVE